MISDSVPTNLRFALLIDGDNAQPTLLAAMLSELSKYGTIPIRRIYGDWTLNSMQAWKNHLQDAAIQPIQQFRNTIGKNATDSALIIDAMDILHSGLTTGMCIVSSDSDFTRLATRVREQGMFVIGIGRKTTPKAFVNACQVFTYTENLQPRSSSTPPSQTTKKPKHATTPERKDGNSEELPLIWETTSERMGDPLPLIRRAFETSAMEDGWANLGTVGQNLLKLDPAFDPRTYGFKQLAPLFRSFPEYIEVRDKSAGKSGGSAIYIRWIEQDPFEEEPDKPTETRSKRSR